MPPKKKIKLVGTGSSGEMKTPISILQELLMKRGEMAQFEVVYQGGPPHQMVFKYQCTAAGVSVIAVGRSKKDAKQESARLCLEELASKGIYCPPPTSSGPFAGSPQRPVPPPPEEGGSAINSYVALLSGFCEEFHLPAPIDELVSDTGPPHCRQFEVRVRVGAHSRSAVAYTKKTARQTAAQALYLYLKQNLTKVMQDFVEEDALARANLKAQHKYTEMRDPETLPWRPNLGQKLSEFHLGLKTYTDKERQKEALELIRGIKSGDDVIHKVEEVLKALNLEFEWVMIPSHEKNKVVALLTVEKSYPSFTLGSIPADEYAAKRNTAREALEYLELMLH